MNIINRSKKIRSKKIAVVGIAVLGLVSLGLGAQANEMRVTTRTVYYSDLKPLQVASAETLYKRIRKAAEQVCGDIGSRQLAEAAAARTCVNQAVSASVRVVNSARLTEVYRTHVEGV
jgi:UrcA family protein